MSKLHHPNIIRLFGYINKPFSIVMEYVDGDSLLYYIKNNILCLKYKIKIILEVIKAIIYLHSRKPAFLIHRDLKPHNIMVYNTTKIKY